VQPQFVRAQRGTEAADPRREQQEQGQEEHLQKKRDLGRFEPGIRQNLDQQVAGREQAEADQRKNDALLVFRAQRQHGKSPAA
jgi:hypothetical protein